jgi:hypothetical protein
MRRDFFMIKDILEAFALFNALSDIVERERPCPNVNRRRFEDKRTSCNNTCQCGKQPLPEWGIAGEPADENKVFGAGFEIDEPRARDYDERWKFESDHAAFDRFVTAGEDCVARGLAKKNDAPITKVNAVRKRIEDGPVMGVDLIGETDWWS